MTMEEIPSEFLVKQENIVIHVLSNEEFLLKKIYNKIKTVKIQPVIFRSVTNDNLEITNKLVSTFIKSASLANLEECLGRRFILHGTVSSGQQIGRSIGYPTINVKFDLSVKYRPPLGVYAVTLHHEGFISAGVANYGIRPTVQHNDVPLLEVNLFNFAPVDVDSTVSVRFHHFIRSEQKFSNLEKLKKQICEDKKIAKNVFLKNVFL
eukprot:GHVL01013838.1.p1 GENE.GHVL01013838.1~~GHVL01013838.1.p1  ORF type:complete len:208 (-),score=53.68 GHVL01013838.1:2-625(-)